MGFDIERHVYGEARYPAQLVLQDVLTIHGSQFASADLIVASPPCQAYSYRAMPWKRAKALPPPSNELFDACFRIQREAIEAAGRFIPLVVENVRGAQPWVGRAKWHFGSFYLWGDVPALMPIARHRNNGKGGPVDESLSKFVGSSQGGFRGGSWFDKTKFSGREGDMNRALEADGVKVSTMGAGWYPPDHPKHVRGLAFNGHAERAIKNTGGSWFNIGSPGQKEVNRNPVHALSAEHGRKVSKDELGGYGGGFGWDNSPLRRGNSKSSARKAASAHIAKIPLVLARHIARAWYPAEREVSA